MALSCEPGLTLDEALLNRPCVDTDCLAGYDCVQGRCVPTSSLVDGGEGSVSGGQSSAGAINGNDPTGSGSSSGSGAATGAGGASAGSAPGGDAGSSSASGAGGAGGEAADAGVFSPDRPDAGPAPDAGCAPIRIFLDRDDDGFGSDVPADQDVACEVPQGWVTVGGDCFDAIPTLTERADEVHPGQTDFFIAGYHPDPNVLSVVSFDYDCSGTEDPGDNPFDNAEAPDCSALGVPCAAVGYERSDRTGDDIHPLCGSEFIVICNSAGNQCAGARTSTDDVFACR